MADETDLPRQALDAMVRGEPDDFEALCRRLDRPSQVRFGRLVYSGLSIMANRRWNPGTDTADVRAWVADLRSELEVNHGDLDPVSCESLIIAVVGGDGRNMEKVDREKFFSLESCILLKLVGDEDLTEEQFQDLLAEAERRTAEWMRTQPPAGEPRR